MNFEKDDKGIFHLFREVVTLLSKGDIPHLVGIHPVQRGVSPFNTRGRIGFDGIVETRVAGRGFSLAS